MRTADDINAATFAAIDARLSNVRTEAGEPIADMVRAVSEEQARAAVLASYAVLSATIDGWQTILADTAFQASLAEAYGVSSTNLDQRLLRTLGLVGAPVATDIEALLFRDFGRFATAFGRPRVAATFATGTQRLYVADNNPVTILRGGTVRGGAAAVLFDTVTDVIGAAPGLDLAAGRYYVDVSVRCRTAGLVGNAPRTTVQSVVSGLPTVVATANPGAFEGGRDVESNAALLAALQDRQGVGTSIATPNGLRNWVLRQAGVIDCLVVGPGDSLMERAAGGAVDVYVAGADLKTAVSVLRVLVEGETVVLPIQPVRTISSVVAGSPLSEGNAFTSAADQGVYAGSARARTSLTWFTVANGGPAVSTDVTVTYQYNDLVRDLQAQLDGDPDRDSLSGSVLVREAARITTFITATVVPLPGTTLGDAKDAVTAAVQVLIGGKRLGDDLDYSDVLVAAATAKIDGVVVIDRIDDLLMGTAADGLTTHNIPVADDSYLTLESLVLS